MIASNNKKTYQSPESKVLNLRLSANILAGSDAGTFSLGTNLTGLDGFGGGYDPSLGD